MVVFWRRADVAGLERLELIEGAGGVRAVSTVISVADDGFRLNHVWQLTRDWGVVSLYVEREGVAGRRTLNLDRDGNGWRVDGQRRPDLAGADDPDLSVTPFCNTLPIRRLLNTQQASLTVEVPYVNGTDLTVTRSRQRYDRQETGYVRYTDLGMFPGFEALLHIDDRALVLSYQHLFERVDIPPS